MSKFFKVALILLLCAIFIALIVQQSTITKQYEELAVRYEAIIAQNEQKTEGTNISTEEAIVEVEPTPDPVKNIPVREVEATFIENKSEPPKNTVTPTPKPTTSNTAKPTKKPESKLEDLSKLISESANKYNQMIRKIMQSPQSNMNIYTKSGEYLKNASVYKYNDQYFVMSKDRRGFIAEYNNTYQRYEAREILPNIDVYGGQIYFEVGFSLLYTSNTIEVWRLGEKKDSVTTPWAQYLRNFDGRYVGHSLNNPNIPFYIKQDGDKLYFFRFLMQGEQVRVDALTCIEFDYYIMYRNCIFYKQGSSVYVFNGFAIDARIDDVKSLDYNKDTYEPIITMTNGKVIYGNELL